tara:strand:+ start:156 stop:641 length:486 start_codon:yes stop_codon:yes gene_type:complete
MQEISKKIEDIIVEQVNLLNKKIKGINFLELLKFNIIEKIKPLFKNYTFDQTTEFINEKKINNDNILIEIKIIFIDKPSLILKKVLLRDTLIISLKELIQIDVIDNGKNKKIQSFSILPLMGVCLSEKTHINLNFLKNCFYLEIKCEDNVKNIDIIKKDTI